MLEEVPVGHQPDGLGGSKSGSPTPLTSSISTGFELEVRTAVIRLQYRLLATGLVHSDRPEASEKAKRGITCAPKAIKEGNPEVLTPWTGSNQPTKRVIHCHY